MMKRLDSKDQIREDSDTRQSLKKENRGYDVVAIYIDARKVNQKDEE